MNLQVAIRGFQERDFLRNHAETKTEATLRRFRDRIVDARVLLEDVTGPNKQSIDKRCRIDVRLRRGEKLTISEVGTDIFASFAAAVGRLKAAIGRRVGRVKRGIGAG